MVRDAIGSILVLVSAVSVDIISMGQLGRYHQCGSTVSVDIISVGQLSRYHQ